METATNVIPDAPGNPQPKPAPLADIGSLARGQAANRVQAELQKPKRGRPSNAERAARGNSTETRAPAQIDPALAQQIDALFKPEAWAPLMTLPADAMLMLTGHEHWNVKDTERAALGASASTAARFLVSESPRTLAVIMVCAAVVSVYAPRAIKEMAMRGAEKAKKEQK